MSHLALSLSLSLSLSLWHPLPTDNNNDRLDLLKPSTQISSQIIRQKQLKQSSCRIKQTKDVETEQRNELLLLPLRFFFSTPSVSVSPSSIRYPPRWFSSGSRRGCFRAVGFGNCFSAARLPQRFQLALSPALCIGSFSKIHPSLKNLSRISQESFKNFWRIFGDSQGIDEQMGCSNAESLAT